MENNHNPMEDDGSLDFLKIPAGETNKHFNCPETTQQKLINLTFWVCDYIEGVKTKFGENRTLVKIKMNRDDHDRDARKFFTNSREIKYVLAKIREMDKFPRPGNDAGIGNAVLFGVMYKGWLLLRCPVQR